MDTGTNLFDESFTESVLDSLDFGYPTAKHNVRKGDKEIKWWCIKGGTRMLTAAMLRQLKIPMKPNCKVTRLVLKELVQKMAVEIEGQAAPVQYDHVISTMPLPCLRSVDTTGAKLTYEQDLAIRCCHYDASVKVGIKFKTRWWQDNPAINIHGGSSNTDRPARTVVYPSYGMFDPTATGVLIASYSWSQDALRLGALIQGPGSDAEKELITVVLRDLAAIHEVSMQFLTDQMVGYYAHNWYDDPHTQGAFALYGPGQFGDLFAGVTRPASGGLLHIAGEAASVHHAWVAGALNSAWRSVAEILIHEGMWDKLKMLEQEWPIPDEISIETLIKQVGISRAAVKSKK